MSVYRLSQIKYYLYCLSQIKYYVYRLSQIKYCLHTVYLRLNTACVPFISD